MAEYEVGDQTTGMIEEPLGSIVEEERGSRWAIHSFAALQLPGTLNGTIVFPSAGIIVAILGGLMITSLLFEFLTNALFRFLKRRKISKRLLLAAYKELMILGFISFFAFLSQNVFFSEIPGEVFFLFFFSFLLSPVFPPLFECGSLLSSH
jgi:hypothetical protein